eukprot:COSAG01_NODE_35364_length_533_cov_0.656682_1_plen_39_part_01
MSEEEEAEAPAPASTSTPAGRDTEEAAAVEEGGAVVGEE